MPRIKKFGIATDAHNILCVTVKFEGFEEINQCEKFLAAVKLLVERQTTLKDQIGN